jgi:molecular chaperone GrpE
MPHRTSETSALVEAARQRTIADVMLEILPIADNLQRAIAVVGDPASETTDGVSIIEGVRATDGMLVTALNRFGVRKVESLGATFDPLLHDARWSRIGVQSLREQFSRSWRTDI